MPVSPVMCASKRICCRGGCARACLASNRLWHSGGTSKPLAGVAGWFQRLRTCLEWAAYVHGFLLAPHVCCCFDEKYFALLLWLQDLLLTDEPVQPLELEAWVRDVHQFSGAARAPPWPLDLARTWPAPRGCSRPWHVACLGPPGCSPGVPVLPGFLVAVGALLIHDQQIVCTCAPC